MCARSPRAGGRPLTEPSGERGAHSAGGGGHGAGARGWWRARHPRALRGRRSDSHACGQRRRVVRRAASRRARSARGRRALVGDSSPSEERGAGEPGASQDARSLKSPSQTRKTRGDSRKYAVSPVLGARPRPRPRTGPATCRANWLVGGGAASPSERRKQCMQLCLRPELVAQADACAVLRTWFSRRGRPRGETSREHSRQGPQGVPRDHRLFDFVWISCSLLPPRCPVHPTHGVS